MDNYIKNRYDNILINILYSMEVWYLRLFFYCVSFGLFVYWWKKLQLKAILLVDLQENLFLDVIFFVE
jgi:hypothetical protein